MFVAQKCPVPAQLSDQQSWQPTCPAFHNLLFEQRGAGEKLLENSMVLSCAAAGAAFAGAYVYAFCYEEAAPPGRRRVYYQDPPRSSDPGQSMR